MGNTMRMRLAEQLCTTAILPAIAPAGLHPAHQQLGFGQRQQEAEHQALLAALASAGGTAALSKLVRGKGFSV